MVASTRWRRTIRLAAAAGCNQARNNLGQFYEAGRSVEQSDAHAMRLYRLAADGGNLPAQFNLGSLYERGRGALPSPAEAARWYGKAASGGHKLAREALRRLEQPLEHQAEPLEMVSA